MARYAVGLAVAGVVLAGCGAQPGSPAPRGESQPPIAAQRRSAASGRWSTPVSLIRAFAYPDAAGNAAGAEAFVWQVESTKRSLNGVPISFIRARLRLPGGRLTKTQTISRTDQIAMAASVRLDAAGNATAVWIGGDNLRTNHIMVAVRPRDGRFGTPVAVADSGISAPALAVAGDGAAVIAWSSDYGHTQAVMRSPGRCADGQASGCFGAVRTFEGGGDPALTLGPAGSAYLAWPGRRGGVAVAVAARGGQFGAPQTTPAAVSSQPAVAVRDDGSAVIAWRASQVSSEESSRWAPIRAAVLDPAGHLSAPRTLSRADGDTPRVAVNRQGEAIVLWQQRSRNGNRLAAAIGVGRRFGAPVELSPPSEEQDVNGSVVVDWRGDVVLVYDHDGGVFGRVRGPGGSFAAATRLNPRGTRGILAAPVIAAARKITAVWGARTATQLSDWTP